MSLKTSAYTVNNLLNSRIYSATWMHESLPGLQMTISVKEFYSLEAAFCTAFWKKALWHVFLGLFIFFYSLTLYYENINILLHQLFNTDQECFLILPFATYWGVLCSVIKLLNQINLGVKLDWKMGYWRVAHECLVHSLGYILPDVKSTEMFIVSSPVLL